MSEPATTIPGMDFTLQETPTSALLAASDTFAWESERLRENGGDDKVSLRAVAEALRERAESASRTARN